MVPLILSQRLPADLSPSPLYTQLQTAPEVAGLSLVDLTMSNPTACGFAYPSIDIPVLGPQTWQYAPEPLGQMAARRHLARYLQARAIEVQAEDIVLTASTSEAYSTLFKLLCNPGDGVATATPGYPLVAHLAELDAVGVHYFRWRNLAAGEAADLDWDSVAAALAQKMAAVVLVQPSSPLGHSLPAAKLERLGAMCTRAGCVLIIDAVFEAYTKAAPSQLTRLPESLHQHGATLVLGGLSKAGGMPQLKLGWMLVYGDAAWTTPIKAGLEWIGDAYLSVATPVQVALPKLLPELAFMQRQIQTRIQVNGLALRQALEPIAAFVVLPYVGGWNAVIQGPAGMDEDRLVAQVRRQAAILLHPGYFYDFDSVGFWVLSLIVPVIDFATALPRLAAVLRALSLEAR